VHNCRLEVYRRSLYSSHVLSLLLSSHTTYYFSRLNLRSLLLHPSIPILHSSKVIVRDLPFASQACLATSASLH